MQNRPNAIEIEIEIQQKIKEGEGDEVVVSTKKEKRIVVQQAFPIIRFFVFKGGGVRATAYAGAMKVFEKYCVTDDIEAVAGSSAGAIAALITALGIPAEEGERLLFDLSMLNLMENSKPWSRTPEFFSTVYQAGRVFWKHCVSSGTSLLSWLQSQIVAKQFDKIFQEENISKKGEDATFQDLANIIEKYKKEGKKCPYKYLYVTVTNIATNELEIDSHETKPHKKIAESVRQSAGIPPMFDLFKRRADGGIKDNLPYKIFDDPKFIDPRYKRELKGNPQTLSLLVDPKKDAKQLWGVYEKQSLEAGSDKIKAFSNALIDNVDRDEIRKGRLFLTIKDKEEEVNSTDLHIKDTVKFKMISGGEADAQEFLENYINAVYDYKSFPDDKAWIKSFKTLDDIATVIREYRNLKEKVSKQKQPIRDKATLDPENPTVEEVDYWIKFFEDYFEKFKNKIINGDESEIDLSNIPPYHINLPPAEPEYKWGELVKADMEKRLQEISPAIIAVKEKAKKEKDMLTSQSHYGISEENTINTAVKNLAGYKETYKFLKQRKKDLENKLNIKSQKLPQTVNVHSGLQYNYFCSQIQNIQAKISTTPSLIPVLGKVDLFDGKIIFNPNDKETINFSLDLSQSKDRKLFLLAGMLYLNSVKSPNTQLRELYNNLYGCSYLVLDHLPQKNEKPLHKRIVSNAAFIKVNDKLYFLNQEKNELKLIEEDSYQLKRFDQYVPQDAKDNPKLLTLNQLQSISMMGKNFFDSNNLLIPDSYSNLAKILGQDDTEVLVSAYRMQGLLNWFSKNAYAKSAPNIDKLLGVLIKSKKANREDNNNQIEIELNTSFGAPSNDTNTKSFLPQLGKFANKFLNHPQKPQSPDEMKGYNFSK